MKSFWWSLVDYVRYIFGRETRDDAWIAGARDSDEGWQQHLDEKDTWIAECGMVLADVAKSISPDEWDKLTPHSRDFLMNYV